jgi:hypothetical protein
MCLFVGYIVTIAINSAIVLTASTVVTSIMRVRLGRQFIIDNRPGAGRPLEHDQRNAS